MLSCTAFTASALTTISTSTPYACGFGFSDESVTAPNRKHHVTYYRHSIGTDVDDVDGSVAGQVKGSRYLRHLGILLGSSLFLTSALIIDPGILLTLVIGAATFFYVNTQRHNEESEPLQDSCFEVRESTIRDAGMGLFAAEAIAPNKYLFAYEGERLDEDAYFSRYPDGQGRYVAVIDEQLPILPLASLVKEDESALKNTLRRLSEPTYIDAIDPDRSNLARYMNSNSINPNVVWTKQRFGRQAGTMHFYTIDKVEVGNELFFDYGANYWDAVQN
jgi:hypothetical protein